MKLRVVNVYWERLRRWGISSGADFLRKSPEECATILGLHKDQKPKFYARLAGLKATSQGYGSWINAQAVQAAVQ